MARRAALAALVLLAAACGSSDPIAWTQLGPQSQVIARAIVVEGGCPSLTVDGARVAMRERAAPSAAFPVRSCEAVVPPQATSASIDGQPLALPAARPTRFAVLGDTGCRVQGARVQACDDPAAWPAADVSAAIAASSPDLILHVGDYLYRLGPCPAGEASCGPTGDDWASWYADFFAPFARALAAAPWVFVRGNHELCGEGGDGWFRLLDPHPYGGCVDYTQPYAVEAGNVRLVVFDSALASDFSAVPEQVAVYERQFADARALAAGATQAWLLLHRPIWAVGASSSPPPATFVDNPTLQAASQNELGAATTLVLSGHLHVLGWYGFVPAADRAPQLVVGTGGTQLDPAIGTSLAGMEIAGAELSTGTTLAEHGFLTIEPGDAGGWDLGFTPVAGGPRPVCELHGRDLSCES
ncbi:MAG: metallophosphoesterase [Thermodesulfobacteriota bacterium]